ncbi:MAG TPA: hypothetical protein VHT02_00150 [Methylocella sp.]|nr:hypothetical protein [Methylocella sp.]
MGDDPLAIYKPTGAKHVDAAKAMGNFTGWAYAASNAIASEVANIQWRLYEVNGNDHEEQEDHPLLTLLEGVNESMTGIEPKYVTASHLELIGVIKTHVSRGFRWNTCQPNTLRRRRIRWRPQLRDRPQYLGEQISRDSDLGHLEGDVAAVAHHLRADLTLSLLGAELFQPV